MSLNFKSDLGKSFMKLVPIIAKRIIYFPNKRKVFLSFSDFNAIKEVNLATVPIFSEVISEK